MRTNIREIDARKAESIANRAERFSAYDREENGGRIVIVGRKAIYICTDAYAIGNISTFDTRDEAIAWAEETLDMFASAE